MTRIVGERYELAEQIGEGGSARVFAAVDRRLGRPVAIKLLNAGLAASADPAGRERFLREGPTSAAFLHRHAVAVFDAGEDSGELYIVMELVDGPSLAQHLTTKGTLDVADSVRIAMQVLGALAAAHAVGIVHRDVKPANILLANNGDAKLADFGIAKRLDELEDSVTRTGTTIGTPRYLTPEQANGAPLSPATDVYAVGIALFEMLTGRTPFAGNSPVAVALAQQTRPAPDVREFRAEIPPSIADAVARALKKDPADRFATAAEMAAALSSTWSPPPAPLPESALQTQVIGESTAVLPVLTGYTAALPTGKPRSRRLRPVPLAFVALIAMLLIGVGALLARNEPKAMVGPDVGATGTLPVIEPAPTEPPVTAAPTNPPPIVDEIIPGFARTGDLQVFLQQLQANPALVGPAGPELTESLAELLGEKANKRQRDLASKLSEQIDEWVKDGQLEPAIAQALTDLLAPLNPDGNDD